MKRTNTDYRDKTIELDGSTFANCQFYNCQLIFRAKKKLSLNNCTFIDCGWQFEGGAGETINLLKMLYNAGGNERAAIELLLGASGMQH